MPPGLRVAGRETLVSTTTNGMARGAYAPHLSSRLFVCESGLYLRVGQLGVALVEFSKLSREVVIAPQ